MADTLRVLGQQYPAAGVPTTLYTVPAFTSASTSSWTACNHAAYAARVRLAVAVAGAADDPKQYLYYDLYVAPNATFAETLGLTLGTTDVILCQSDTGQVSFNLFGVEVM